MIDVDVDDGCIRYQTSDPDVVNATATTPSERVDEMSETGVKPCVSVHNTIRVNKPSASNV